MGKKKPEIFYADIQSRGSDRKVVEIPKDVRDKFNVGQHVKIIMKEAS